MEKKASHHPIFPTDVSELVLFQAGVQRFATSRSFAALDNITRLICQISAIR